MLECRRGEQVVFLKQDQPEFLKRQASGARLFAEAGVPVPRVLTVELDAQPPFMAMDQARGRQLDESDATGQIGPRLLRGVGETIAKIHSVSFDAPGYLDPATYPEVSLMRQDLIEQQRREPWKLQHLVDEGVLDRELADDVIAMSETAVVLIEEARPCLIHGDLRSPHLFADGARIVDVIDLGDVRSDHPGWDFAWLWLYRRSWLDEVAEGYGSWPVSESLLKVFGIQRLVGELAWLRMNDFDPGSRADRIRRLMSSS